MVEDRFYRVFFWLAVFIGVGTILWMGYGYFANQAPGEMDYRAGNTYFNDKRYSKAKTSYLEALQGDPNFVPAYGALANTLVQLKDFDEGLRFINEALDLDPKFGGYYATRGIILDHKGQYKLAIIDYEKAMLLLPEVADGMGMIDRFFNKLPKAPPTVADRLVYLKAQMKLPKGKRVLKVPLLDKNQVPYEQ